MGDVTAKDIIKWVDSETVDRNSIDSITNFVKDLQNQMSNLDFTLPEGRQALGYAGSVDSNIKHNL